MSIGRRFFESLAVIVWVWWTMPIDLPRSVHQMRSWWKPTKLKLEGRPECEDTLVRFHRACSWLQQAEKLEASATDQRLILMWIAFNSLYGQWDPKRREPIPDKKSLDVFSKQILELDADGVVASVLQERRSLVMDIFDDEYLSSWFWEEPTEARGRAARSARRKAQTWYVESKWRMIQDRAVERIYFVRCQLVHGAATCGGQLNRTAVRRCVTMLDWLMKAWLSIWIERGSEVDWGEMCYPPIGVSMRG